MNKPNQGQEEWQFTKKAAETLNVTERILLEGVRSGRLKQKIHYRDLGNRYQFHVQRCCEHLTKRDRKTEKRKSSN